jgi:hypothetical protein
VILFLSSFSGEPGFAGSPTPSYFFSHLTQGKVSGRPDSHALDQQQRQIERQLGGRGR